MLQEQWARQGLRQDIGSVCMGGEPFEKKCAERNVFPNEVVPDIDVFRTDVVSCLFGQRNSPSVVHVDDDWQGEWNMQCIKE